MSKAAAAAALEEAFAPLVEEERLAEGRTLRPAPTPGGVRPFARREIADAMPRICEMLLMKATKGDLPALKVLLEIAQFGQKRGKRRKKPAVEKDLDFARRMLEEYRAA